MASSSGTSSGSTATLFQIAGSEGDLHQVLLMNERRRRRMLSNRESAKRSRMRKQRHLDDLMSLVAQLRKENGNILAAYKLTTQHYIAVETENSVLRTQVAELNTRLQSLLGILDYTNAAAVDGWHLYDGTTPPLPPPSAAAAAMVGSLMNSWGLRVVNQPIMASADAFIQ